MIVSFKGRSTRELFDGTKVDSRWRRIVPRALAKLQMLNAADTIYDLYNPPSNHLEKLRGDREGQFSIRVTARWRLCFRFEDGNAYGVEPLN